MSNRKSIHELLSTPSASKRKLNATYVKSDVRSVFPEDVVISENEAFIERSNKLEDIGLPGTLWKTYRINALYDFSYQKPKLRRYEKILCSVLNDHISKANCDTEYKSHDYSVKIECFHDMVFTEKDNPPVKITILAEDDDDDDDEEGGEGQTIYFTGLLLSIARKNGFMEEERIKAEAILLPLFLVDYKDEIFFESVKWFLEDNFSCLVNPLKFSSCDLLWMLALFCPKNDQVTGTTVIVYDVPFEELNSIEYVIDPFTIAKTFNRITKPNSQEVSEDQVYEFISILESHFHTMFSINLSQLVIREIKTPLAVIQADFIIPRSSSKLYFVMRHLTHLAQEIIK